MKNKENPAMFTEGNVETAMCLWEAALELRNRPYNDPGHILVERFIEPIGTAQARLEVINWVPECEAEWNAACVTGTELVPYDWEHCPAFLERKLAEFSA